MGSVNEILYILIDDSLFNQGIFESWKRNKKKRYCLKFTGTAQCMPWNLVNTEFPTLLLTPTLLFGELFNYVFFYRQYYLLIVWWVGCWVWTSYTSWVFLSLPIELPMKYFFNRVCLVVLHARNSLNWKYYLMLLNINFLIYFFMY